MQHGFAHLLRRGTLRVGQLTEARAVADRVHDVGGAARIVRIGQRFGVQQPDFGQTHHVNRRHVGRELVHEGVFVGRILVRPAAFVVDDRSVQTLGVALGIIGPREAARRRAPLGPRKAVVGNIGVAVEHHPQPRSRGLAGPLHLEDRFAGVHRGHARVARGVGPEVAVVVAEAVTHALDCLAGRNHLRPVAELAHGVETRQQAVGEALGDLELVRSHHVGGVFAGVLLDVLDDLLADGLLRNAGREVERIDLLDVAGIDGGRNLGQHRNLAEHLHHVDPDVGTPAERLGEPLLILLLGERRVVFLHQVDVANDLVGVVHGIHRIVPHGGRELVVAVDLVLFDGHGLRLARTSVGVVGAAFGQDDELVPVVLEVALHVVVHGRKLAFEQFAGVDGRLGVTRAGGVVLGIHGFGEFLEAARRGRDNQRKYRNV